MAGEVDGEAFLLAGTQPQSGIRGGNKSLVSNLKLRWLLCLLLWLKLLEYEELYLLGRWSKVILDLHGVAVEMLIPKV